MSRFSEAEADAASRGREAVMVVDGRGGDITVRKGLSPRAAAAEEIIIGSNG